MISLNGEVIEVTKFPDGTSQVWQINLPRTPEANIEWEFENEEELIHLVQLCNLLKESHVHKINLHVPYLPYARQDKDITNYSTFALHSLAHILNSLQLSSVTSMDVHSGIATEAIRNFKSVAPLVPDVGDMICYPDHGAAKRGYDIQEKSSIYLEKRRDQITGEILGLKLHPFSPSLDLTGKSVLIVDDICDGGRTFIESAKLLKTLGAREIYLYTTHGLYTKGTDILFESGIDKIFNRKGEVTR